MMGVDGLTNDEIKSHLQKYRCSMAATRTLIPTVIAIRMMSVVRARVRPPFRSQSLIHSRYPGSPPRAGTNDLHRCWIRAFDTSFGRLRLTDVRYASSRAQAPFPHSFHPPARHVRLTGQWMGVSPDCTSFDTVHGLNPTLTICAVSSALHPPALTCRHRLPRSGSCPPSYHPPRDP